MSDQIIERLNGMGAAGRAYLEARIAVMTGAGEPEYVRVLRQYIEIADEAADALERAERVVERVRPAIEHAVYSASFVTTNTNGSDSHMWPTYIFDAKEAEAIRDALAAYDTTRAPKSRTTLRREAVQRGEDVPTFDGADTVRDEEAAGIEAVRQYRSGRKNQHLSGLNAEGEKK